MFKPSHISAVALAAAAFHIATPILAQEPTEVTLAPVILSGGLTPVAADAFGRAATVVTAAEIEERGIRSVQDALRAIPGVAVSSTGSSYTQVRIRGAEGNHTLILIDGIEATGGADEYILTGLETANIERIEVLRGPQSVYFGSNASAGVINIITRKGAPGLHYGGSAEIGNGYAVSGFATQRGTRGGLAFNASVRDDHGYDQSGDGGEKDGIRRKTAGLSGDWLATENLRLGFTTRRSTEDYDYDSNGWPVSNAGEYVVDDPNQTSTRDEFTGAVWGEYSAPGGALTQRLEYQDTIYKQSYNGGRTTRGETEKLKYRLSYGLDGAPADASAHLLNLLIERQEDESSSASDYSREMTSYALEYRGRLDSGLDVQAGLRRDNNKTFEDFTSWNIGLSWRIPDTALRLHASAGRAAVNPSYYELFANDSWTAGNPGLTPEQNRGFDIGLEAGFLGGRGLVDVTYFKEKMRDEITYVYGAAPDGRASYINQTGDSPREGVEISAQLQATQALRLGANYTWLDASNPDGSVEIRRPRNELGLTATLDTFGGRGFITADLRHVSGNYDTQYWGGNPTVKLPAYTTVNLGTGYDLSDQVRLTGRVVNLFDKDYSDVWGYASQGRTFYAGIEAKW